MILVALKAAAFGSVSGGISGAMALLAGLDSGQQHVGGVVALWRVRMAGDANHHSVSVMIELGMFEPARTNRGLGYLW